MAMTTLQPPRLVRADTLDLQSHNAPSAQDHTRSPTFSPYAHGSSGMHAREALRSAEESAYNDRKSSPRMSADNANSGSASQIHQYDSTDDDGDDEHQDDQNGGPNDGDYEDGNDENDDDMEDDLLDKISSSPSIEDGKYSQFVRPPRVDCIGNGASPASSPLPTRGIPPHDFNTTSLDTQLDCPMKVHQVGHHLGKDKILPAHYHMDTRDSEAGFDYNVYFRILAAPSLSMDTPTLESDSLFADTISNLLFPSEDLFLNGDEEDYTDDYEYNDDQNWIDEGEPWYQDGSSSDDDLDDFQFSHDSRFLDFGWGGECLQDTEDIDFEFVYALHTFVATVEGQANATKGDTMVLLDDSNSYWWLVRVVKDGSIGYLPAEHIETPTERLARLNKHRNIDLSASMLGDNPEKSKNPLKKAMRRRNAKTVAFTAPTYYEPSEYEYDTEDEDDDDVAERVMGAQAQEPQQSETNDSQQRQQITSTQDNGVTINGASTMMNDVQTAIHSPTSPVRPEASDDLAVQSQAQSEDAIQRSRNGTVRNTDSFFKDENVETKKISLTPRLLRNDSDSQAGPQTSLQNSTDQDLRSKTSSDTFDKMLGSEEKPKEKEKKKEKKGMLSGLFKRKDKSAKGSKSDAEDEKVDDTIRPIQGKDLSEPNSASISPEKRTGKLQKSQQAAPLNVVTDIKPSNLTLIATQPEPSSKPINVAPSGTDTRAVQKEHQTGWQGEVTSEPTTTKQAPASEKRSIFSPITTVLKSSPTHSGDHDTTSKPVYSKRAKERFAIDGSDSEDDSSPSKPQTVHSSQDHRNISPIHDAHAQQSRSDSAMAVSPVNTSESDTDDRPLHSASHSMNSTSEHHQTSPRNIHGTPQSDTASTSKPSPSLATHTPSTSRSTPTWSDASLRSYMENDRDIRDLLIIVHDKSNVTPVGPDHPLMGGLFMTERTRLAEMQTQLDSMLTTWISKKNPGLLAR